MLIFQAVDRSPERRQASRVPNVARTKASKRTQLRAEATRNYIVTPRVFNLSADIRLPRVFVNHHNLFDNFDATFLLVTLQPRTLLFYCVLTPLNEEIFQTYTRDQEEID